MSTGTISNNLKGVGVVTRAMIHARARELALIAGCIPPHVRQVDYEQAKRELMADTDMSTEEVILESLPESKRWDPVPGSEGFQYPEAPAEDEDEEGRSETEQLVDQGAEEAEVDTMVEAARDHEKALRAENRQP